MENNTIRNNIAEFNDALIKYSTVVNTEYERIFNSGVNKELLNIPEYKAIFDSAKEIEKYLNDNVINEEYKKKLDSLIDIYKALINIYSNFYFSQGILLMLNKEGNTNE